MVERAARRSIEEALLSATPSDRRHITAALDLLTANPYPSNPAAPARNFKRIAGSTNRWRYLVSKRFRTVYTVRGNRVIIERLEDRKDAYRRL